MNSERYAKVKELFAAALPLGLDERRELFEEECASDGELRSEVEQLLGHAVSAGPSFLAGRAEDTVPVPRLAIPGFSSFELLDAGGSGVVYRALQESPRREVAIKVLRLDSLVPGQVARFRREAEILGSLHHPGIAQVHGAGVVESDPVPLPWIAMEFVRGRTLSEYVLEEKPPTRDLLELFTTVCEAVEHAHKKSVVHRDLKPTNVMVEESGWPKVLDFGVARTLVGSDLAASQHTRTGTVVGTLAYMAPEQARGSREVDVRADVYALGVMLFELLTGCLPIEVEGLDVLDGIRLVSEREPERLRHLRPDLSLDLELILAKALEKEPSRRYATAGELATDVKNYLADRLVLARRPTAIYQARKFARRNRTLTVTAVVVVLALAVGLAQALSGLRRERESNKRTSTLASLLAGKYFGLSSRLGFSIEDEHDAEEVIVAIEEQLALDRESRPLRALLAQALNAMGDLHQSRSKQVEAERSYARALEVREELVADDPSDRDSLSHISRLYAKLGETARDQGDLTSRDEWFAKALASDEVLVVRFPDDLELREDLGWSLERIADAASARGEKEAALALRLRRLSDAEALVRLDPDNWKLVRNLSHTHALLLGTDPSSDHLEECLRLARREVELRPGARDAMFWLVHAERTARHYSADPKVALQHGIVAFEVACQIMEADPHRIEHLGLLRLAGSEALNMAVEQGRTDLARRVLHDEGDLVERASSLPGLEGNARLALAELEIFEAHVMALDGEGGPTLEERGWQVLTQVAAAGPSSRVELDLCSDIFSKLCSAHIPRSFEHLRLLLESLLAEGDADRARWFVEELCREGRLPTPLQVELAALWGERDL